MAEIEETEVTLNIIADNLQVVTTTTVDKVILNNLTLTQDEVATLAWIANNPSATPVSVEIKVLP
jgi:hypothetical protein